MKIREPKGTWDFVILAWSAYVVFAILFEFMRGENDEVSAYLRWGDTVACAFFFFDVMWRWLASGDKIRFWKWGWIDLIASIPTIDALRWARAFRVFRIFRIIRGMRSLARVVSYFFEDRTKATAVLAMTALFGSVLIAGLLILEFESKTGNIKNAMDALWWSVTTITTVGYGDKYPVTPEGRAVGIGLMFVGISLFGSVSALLASWLLRGAKSESGSLEDLKASLDRIEKLIQKKGGA